MKKTEKLILRKGLLCLLVLALMTFTTRVLNAQVFANKVKSDSTAHHLLPILRNKAETAGFNLPKSAGISFNHIWQKARLDISNLNLGFNGSSMVAVDELIRFNKLETVTRGIHVKPDLWLLPFLNVYAVFVQTENTTAVDLSVFAPNHDIHEALFNYKTEFKTTATTTGFGITPTIGIAGGWLALDMNFTWTDFEQLNHPRQRFTFGPRLGKSFSLKKPERNISFWIGGFRVSTKRANNGSVMLSDVLPFDGSLQSKIATATTSLETKHQELDAWWRTLPPAIQDLNRQRYESISGTLNKASEMIFRLTSAGQQLEQSSIQYSLDRQHQNIWNFVIGSQLQISKKFMIHAEYGFLGSRQHFFSGLQYRLDL